jgi:D-tyrosyl-tRNA(Tyr) deacylase
MKALIQRVSSASVSVAGAVVGEIENGLLVFVGIEKGDTHAQGQRMAERLLSYRVFSDPDGKMNLSVADVDGGLLMISQFTLAADTNKGKRASFSSAAPPEEAKSLFDSLVEELGSQHPHIATGRFGADMQVSLINDGPVTFLLTV